MTEAIEAVLLFSQGVEQLLRRKKIKREFLYRYLAEKGFVAPVTADKPSLIRKLLDLWGCQPREVYNVRMVLVYTSEYIHVLILSLPKTNLTKKTSKSCPTKSKGVTTQMKALDEYFLMLALLLNTVHV